MCTLAKQHWCKKNIRKYRMHTKGKNNASNVIVQAHLHTSMKWNQVENIEAWRVSKNINKSTNTHRAQLTAMWFTIKSTGGLRKHAPSDCSSPLELLKTELFFLADLVSKFDNNDPSIVVNWILRYYHFFPQCFGMWTEINSMIQKQECHLFMYWSVSLFSSRYLNVRQYQHLLISADRTIFTSAIKVLHRLSYFGIPSAKQKKMLSKKQNKTPRQLQGSPSLGWLFLQCFTIQGSL